VDKDLNKEQQKQKSQAFLEESRIVPDLRGNPLMLSLMCNIYRGENYIPRNRPEVYEKCANMLFERWDKSRGILVPQAMEAFIKPAMQHLAHWIFADEALQGGVTEQQLTEKASEYLGEWRFDNHAEAEKAARDFIEFCRGRAWVFTDTGTTKEGERLYQFTHRTFLEFFTAAHLVRTRRTPGDLGGFLRPRISSREWDVVAQLAFQIQNNNIEGAGDELLKDIIDEGRETKSVEGLHLLSFAARCLEFMVPRPKIAREVSTACVEHCMDWGLAQTREDIPRGNSEPLEIFPGLLSCAAENRLIVAGTIQTILTDRINNGKERESILAIDIAMHLMWFFHLGRKGQAVPSDISAFWSNVTETIYADCSQRVASLSPRNLQVCIEVFNRGKIGITELRKWHGTEAIFFPALSLAFPQFWSASPASTLLTIVSLSSPSVHAEFPRWELQVKELARTLPHCPTPWFRRAAEKYIAFPIWALEVSKEKPKQTKRKRVLDAETMFGAFLVSAALMETTRESDMARLVHALRETQLPLFVGLAPLLLARVGQADPSLVARAIERAEFDTAQRAFITRWVSKELSLVGVAAGDDNGQSA
jgi:hypothetical protein